MVEMKTSTRTFIFLLSLSLSLSLIRAQIIGDVWNIPTQLPIPSRARTRLCLPLFSRRGSPILFFFGGAMAPAERTTCLARRQISNAALSFSLTGPPYRFVAIGQSGKKSPTITYRPPAVSSYFFSSISSLFRLRLELWWEEKSVT